jgi:putative transposase
MRHISELIVRIARDNPRWGYTRIQGALGNLSHKVGRGTIANVLKRNEIEPSPERSRRTPRSTFLKAHWKVLAASDFPMVEVWTAKGLVTYYLLFLISLADRAVNIAGITTRPDESWIQGHPSTADVAEPKRPCRAIRTLDKTNALIG